MASTQQKVVVVIVGKDELSDVAKKVQDALNGMGDGAVEASQKQKQLTTSSVALGSMLGNLAERALTAAARQMRTLGEKAIDTASMFEQYRVSLTVLTGSTEKANQVLAELNEFSIKTPFTPAEVMASGRSLVAYGFQLQDIEKMLKTAGDAASTFSDTTNLEEMVNVLGRLKSGQFGESFERLRTVGVTRDLLEGAGLKFDRSGAYVGSVEQALAGVQKVISDRYGGMMEQQAKTFEGLKSTFTGYGEEFLNKIMQSGAFDFLKEKLEGAIKSLDAAIQSGEFEKWAKDIGQAIEEFLTKLWDVGKWFWDNRETLMEFARWIAIVFAVGKVEEFSRKVLGGFSQIELSAKGLEKSGASIGKGFQSALKSPIVWAAAAELAILGINTAFDALNKNIEKNLQLTEDMVSAEAKQQNAVIAVQKGLGTQAWQKLLDELDLRGKSVSEKFQNLAVWAQANKKTDEEAAKVAALLNAEIGKNKKKIEEAAAAQSKLKGAVEGTGTASKETSGVTELYQQILDSLADKTIPALEAKYEAINLLFGNSAEMAKLTGSQIEGLQKEYTDLGIELGKFDNLKMPDMSGFIDDLEVYQNFSIEGFQESLGIAQDIASAMAGNYAGLAKYLSAAGTETKKTMSDIEEIAVGLQQWSDGMAEFLNMLGLVGGELSDASAGIAQIGQGIQQIVNAGEDFSALMDGVNSIGQGLAGIFGGEESDMSQLISGASNVGTGVAKALSGDPTGIVQALAGIPDLLDGLFESTQEGYVKQLGKQGFDDTYSQELLDKMSAISDAKGDKSFGMKAYIEDFFKETDISNKDEFTRMSDLLNESIGEDIAQGYTTEEAYAKYGDELEQLTAAQEKYGFETTTSLQDMLDLQRSGTKEGRVGGISDAIGGIDKMIEGMSKAGYSDASFTSVFGLLQSSFQKLQAEGLSMQEIFEKVSPVVDKAREAAEKAGVSTAPMDALIAYTEKMKNAAPILDVISGLDMAIKGLGSTGTLTQKNLDDMALTAQETIKKLEAQGFSPTEIAAQMGPAISDMTSAAEKFGYDLPQDIVNLGAQIDKLGLGGEKSPAEEIANWGTAYLEQTKAWGDSMIKTLEGLGGYAEGGVVPGNGGAQLAWVHGGETVIPQNAVPYMAAINQQQQQQPLELRIILEEKSGGQDYLKNLIGVTVETKTKNGEIKIASSSMEG